MKTQQNYIKETPYWMIFLIIVIGGIAVLPIANLIILGWSNLKFDPSSSLNLTELGQLGDFFGGHTSAFAGSISLLVVLFFTFHQAKQQSIFFQIQQSDSTRATERQFFLEGVNLITQWDINSPGCDQSMRLLDYYSRIALQSNDQELLLILNTVITAKIRANLEGKNDSFRSTNYMFACEAIKKIGQLRELDAKGYKNMKKKDI